MKRLLLVPLLSVIMITGFSQKLSVTNLRCEYRTDPVGIDVPVPAFSWELESDQRNVKQTAYRVIVADSREGIEKNTGNIWDSRKMNADASVQLRYNGRKLASAKQYFWKVMVWDNKGNVSEWSRPAYWQMGLLKAGDWKDAKWIGYAPLADSSRIIPLAHGKGKKAWGERKNILPLLRKAFTLSGPVKKATAFISGLGHFEMSVNGKKTGDHFLDPGWTQYSRHALYVTFDITPQLQPGENAIGVMLGNGFYYIPGERYRKLTGAYGNPSLMARILVEYTDGTTQNIVSDESWKAAPSPVIFSSIYGGEDYDARLEQNGWNAPGFNDRQWQQAVIVKGPPELHAQTAEAVKVMQQFTAGKKTQLSSGKWIYDLEQNFSGIPSITVRGQKGDTVRIVPAELVNEDGTANQKGSGGPSYYNYILKGDGEESWQPRFTYYGFRYLQVEGAVPAGAANPAQLPEVVQLSGLHIRNAAAPAGSFRSSNSLFNKTYDLINWAIKSNMVSVFTDCPHREKLGWLEQTHLMGSSVQYNYDIAALNRKIIRDMQYAQTVEGLVPEIAPEYVQFGEPFRDSPEWGSAAVIVPWYHYLWYGDKRSLQDAYGMMKRYVSYLQKKSTGHLLLHGLGDWYDIGPERPGFSQLTPLGFTATAVYYYDLTIMARIATLLGQPRDAIYYKQLAARVKAAFNKKYYDPETHQYATGSQTANAMALYMQLAEPANRQAVLTNLINDIRNRNNALTAGDVGYRYVLRALEEAGRSDVIYDMNSRSEVPGYGYQLAHGATALTESWQAYPSVSNNHFMLGHLMEWFYTGLCGIQQATDGIAFRKLVIHPQPVGNVTQAQAAFHSPYGPVYSEWIKHADSLELKIHIPANATADIYLPAEKQALILESGKTISTEGTIKIAGYRDGCAVVQVGSGSYHFVISSNK